MAATDILHVAVAQIAPVWLDRERTLDKILAATEEAARQGAELVVAAAFDAATATVRVERLDPASGAALATLDLPAPALRGLAVAPHGGRVAVLTGAAAEVLDADLALLESAPMPGAGTGVAFDAAGVETFVIGDSSIYFAGPDGERLELISDPLGEMYGMKVV